MRQTRAGHHRPVLNFDTSTLLSDFDQIEETENELVRQVQHGHSFDGASQDAKPSHGRIYSL